MSILTLLSLISFIICITLAITVYFKGVRYVFNNQLSKIFMLLCLSLAFCWALIEFGYRQAGGFITADFWLKINISWYFVMSLLLHFSLLFTENTKLLKKRLTYLIIYGPAVIFFIVDIGSNLLSTTPLKEFWGWTYGIPKYPLVHGISSTWAAFTGLFCMYILLEHLAKIKNIEKKKQIKPVIFGLVIPVAVGFNTEWLFPLLQIKFPELIVPAMSIGLLIIWYSIWIYSPLENKKRHDYIKTQVDYLLKTQ